MCELFCFCFQVKIKRMTEFANEYKNIDFVYVFVHIGITEKKE